MIYFLSDSHFEPFPLNEEAWRVIKDFIFFFDDKEPCPVFNHSNWLDMDLCHGYMLSSHRAKYISLLIENYLPFIDEFQTELDMSLPLKLWLDFSDFLKHSKGVEMRFFLK